MNLSAESAQNGCGEGTGSTVTGDEALSGIKCRGRYKGYTYSAVIENGFMVLDGRRFKSLTAAAFSVTRQPYIDGKLFWEFESNQLSGWRHFSETPDDSGFLMS